MEFSSNYRGFEVTEILNIEGSNERNLKYRGFLQRSIRIANHEALVIGQTTGERR